VVLDLSASAIARAPSTPISFPEQFINNTDGLGRFFRLDSDARTGSDQPIFAFYPLGPADCAIHCNIIPTHSLFL
jgi:hypothetical protein